MHKLAEIGVVIAVMLKRLGAKPCNCAQIASLVFDPDQKNGAYDRLIDLLS
jgi:hypothetical protein